MKITLVGYYGFGNFGDELMLLTLIHKLKDRVSKLNVVTKGNNYQAFENVSYIEPDKKSLKRTYKDSDLIIWGGGTCFYSNKGFRSLFVNFAYAKLILRKRFIFFGVGKGKFDNFLDLIRFYFILLLSDDIYYRDKFSIAETSKLTHKKLKLTGDLVYAFGFDEINRNKKNLLNNISLNIIGDLNNGSLITFYKKSVEYLLKKFPNSTVYLLPAQINEKGDLQILKKIKSEVPSNRVNICEPTSPNDVINCLLKMDFHIGMRLHLNVVSDILGVPNIGIQYSPKVKYYFDSIEDSKDRLLDIMEDITYEKILNVFKNYSRPYKFIELQKQLVEKTFEEILL